MLLGQSKPDTCRGREMPNRAALASLSVSDQALLNCFGDA